MTERPASYGIHTISIEFDHHTISPSLTFDCHASDKADCRTMCPESECEEGCVRPDEHERVPVDYCNFVEWMSNVDDPENCIVSDSTTITAPIDIAWCQRWDGPDWEFINNGGSDD